MDAAAAEANFIRTQEIFSLISSLQLIAHLWPQSDCVEDGAKYDFIVVGGGTAGCVIASALAKYNVRVLLVEAGGTPPLESYYPAYFSYPKHSVNDWNMTSTHNELFQYHKGSRADITQGKMLGGSSGLHYMAYLRGDAIDYDSWAALTNDTSWSFKSVLPLFHKNEGLIDPKILNSPADKVQYGICGKIKLRRYYDKILNKYLSAFKELGNKVVVDLNEINPYGFTPILFGASNKERASTARLLRYPRKKINLDILMNALVTKILFNDQHVAIGVLIKTENGSMITVKANKEVIISAGVFKTPQLLMVSGIGPKQHLKEKNIKVIKDLPVGENLQDHLMNPLVYKMGKARPISGPHNPHLLEKLAALYGKIAINKGRKRVNYQILSLMFDVPEQFLIVCSILLSYTDEVCNNLIKGAGDKQIFIVFNLLTYPESRGRVLLNTVDMNDQPVIHIGYDKDLETHVKTNIHFNVVLNTTYFRSVGAELIDPKLKTCARFDKNSKDYWRCYSKSLVTVGHYFVGTCAMGHVVESNLLVKGVKNLRVADASIIPKIVSSPTQAAVIMIAVKSAKMIVEEHCLL